MNSATLYDLVNQNISNLFKPILLLKKMLFEILDYEKVVGETGTDFEVFFHTSFYFLFLLSILQIYLIWGQNQSFLYSISRNSKTRY